MPLQPGTRLGPYAVTAKIGEGGMGEVWQARDTKLDRDVALKVLPEAFTSDPDRLARFEREAKVLASLNHPNIGSIYGLEEAEGVKALVLELVEGPTLADRIKQGPIPLDEALPIAKQIAEALEAAHERGVIHRDLKPANVKVREDGTVKVLDFGLAKAFQPDASDPGLSASPTISLTAAATQMGMIIGTAAYMSPEQAKGKTVGKQADVWAFGAVLFEMLSGKRPFTGDDVSETLARVIDREPDWATLPASVPPVLSNFIQRCLQKNPKKRIRDIGDVSLAMEGAFEMPASAAAEPAAALPRLQVWQRPVPATVAMLAAVVIGGLFVWGLVRPAPAPAGAVTRVSFILPEGDVVDPNDGITLSPDGTMLVYAGARDGAQQLFVRTRDQMTVRPLPGTEGAVHPFFSPDGAWVGFFTPDSLKKVALAGGPPVTLCAVGARQGATWGPDDTIVFASSDAPGLMQVSAAGGEPRPLTEPAEGARHRWPTFVPGGEAVLYTILQGSLDTFEVAVVSLDTSEQQTLVRGTDGVVTPSGHLVFGREASLWAVPFDSDRLTVSGEPAPVVEGVQVNSGGWAHYALASDGTLVYLPAAVGEGGGMDLVWVDRVTGEETPLGAPLRSYVYPRISPNGTRVAVDSSDQQQDIWVWDLTGETLTRLTFDAAQEQSGTWTPDGERVIFSSTRDGVPALFWRAADGTGTAEPLGESERPRFPQAVAPDGSVVVVAELVGGNANLITVSLTGDPASEDLLVTEFNEGNAVLSPDGRWFAYQSDASGEMEVYVRPFPDADGALQQISTNGGTLPLWAPDGSELFYENEGRLLAVPVQTAPSFSRGTPMVVIEDRYLLSSAYPGRVYDIDPSGERFLLRKFLAAPSGDGRSLPSLTFVFNWFRELTERGPIPEPCLLNPAPPSARILSPPRSAKAAWVKSGRPATPSSTATWR